MPSRGAKAKTAGTLDYSLGDRLVYERWLAENENSVAKRKEAVRDDLAVEAVPSSCSTGRAVGANDFCRGAPSRRAPVMEAVYEKQGDGGESEIKRMKSNVRARNARRRTERKSVSAAYRNRRTVGDKVARRKCTSSRASKQAADYLALCRCSTVCFMYTYGSIQKLISDQVKCYT